MTPSFARYANWQWRLRNSIKPSQSIYFGMSEVKDFSSGEPTDHDGSDPVEAWAKIISNLALQVSSGFI